MKIKKQHLILSVIALCSLLLADQYTKRLAVVHLKGQEPFVILNRVLEFSYLENTGAAFSSFMGKQTFLIALTTIVTLLLLWKYFTLPEGKRFVPMRLCMLFIISGAVGNLIDRVRLGYVVDMFNFQFVSYPVFNVADILVVCGTIGFAAYYLLLHDRIAEKETSSNGTDRPASGA